MPNNFIEHSLINILSFLKQSIFAEEYAYLEKGFLQSIDPHIKVLSIFVFLISTLLLKNIALLCCMYLLCLCLAYLSQIHLRFFLIRTWIFIPLFSLFIALPALFNIFTAGETLLSFKVIGINLIITKPGLFIATRFVMRILTSLSFVILLSLTTRHTQLLKVLRIFKIPQIFVITLGMCYRYIYLFIGIVENNYLAIKSRVGIRIPYQKGQKIVALKIAHLWQRSAQLNQEVYNAMLSRGYSGEPVVLDEFKTDIKDWAWLSSSIIILGLIVYHVR